MRAKSYFGMINTIKRRIYTIREGREIKEKFQQNKYVTKDDLIRIVEWKFPGRRLAGQ